jgi:hypothetical protein
MRARSSARARADVPTSLRFPLSSSSPPAGVGDSGPAAAGGGGGGVRDGGVGNINVYAPSSLSVAVGGSRGGDGSGRASAATPATVPAERVKQEAEERRAYEANLERAKGYAQARARAADANSQRAAAAAAAEGSVADAAAAPPVAPAGQRRVYARFATWRAALRNSLSPTRISLALLSSALSYVQGPGRLDVGTDGWPAS